MYTTKQRQRSGTKHAILERVYWK